MGESGSSSARRTGGCQCGAVRFAAAGAPEDASVCDCRMCQKAGGGPFMALARYATEAVIWTRGRPTTFQSSTVVTRGFCSDCGTPLTYQRRPEALSLAIGTFDAPADLVPTSRLGTETRLPWTDHVADLPAQTTEAWLAATPGLKERLRSCQHPDHDT